MAMLPTLTKAEIDRALILLPSWRLEENGSSLTRHFRFESFPSAIAFMTELAFVVERMNHHPEWSNVHSNVDVRLTTHDAGGITRLDIELAIAMDRCAANKSMEAVNPTIFL